MQKNKMKRLYDKLWENSRSDFYPFHMPGHKRMAAHPFLKDFPNPYTLDITEIDGFDNLHHPEGILKESMEWAASVYGADKTYYLVNGSSCGILSAICGATDRADTIIMSRNSHKSAYHGAFLNQLNIKYIYPRIVSEFGIQGGIEARELERALKICKDAAAVFVVSPTYDGVVSDIRTLADLCHAHDIPLIVDEAHGAHFPYGERFPESALNLGADAVVQSLHKTLPAFTQTALLHLKKGYINIEKIEYFLQIFQSSSPSYLFMAGMERCIEFMEGRGRKEMKRFERDLTKLRNHLKEMKHLKLLDRSAVVGFGAYDFDDSKIVVSARGTTINGRQLMDRLRTEYHIEMEMCGADYVTAITSVMDTREGLKRLEEAFIAIDCMLDDRVKNEERKNTGKTEGENEQEERGIRKTGTGVKRREETEIERREETEIERREENDRTWKAEEPKMTLYEAWGRKKKQVPVSDSAGMISGEFIYLYPPGIPLVVPGEMMTDEIVNIILSYREKKLPVQGLMDYKGEWIQVLEKQDSCDIL